MTLIYGLPGMRWGVVWSGVGGGGGDLWPQCLCQNVLPSRPKLLPDNHLFPSSRSSNKFLFMCVSQTESPLLIFRRSHLSRNDACKDSIHSF